MMCWYSGYLPEMVGSIRLAASADPGFSGPGSQRVWLYGTVRSLPMENDRKCCARLPKDELLGALPGCGYMQ